MRKDMCKIHHMKALSPITIIVSLLSAMIISFAGGYVVYSQKKQGTDPVTRDFKRAETTTRLKALQSVTPDNLQTYESELLLRFADPHHFVKARAAEKIYRMGLSKKIPPHILQKALENLDSDGELTKRWVIANIIAINYENGFNLFALNLKELTSPYTRMFLTQLLVIHSKGNTAAIDLLNKKITEKGAARAIARRVEQMLNTDREHWFKGFFPKELIIVEAPQLKTTTQD